MTIKLHAQPYDISAKGFYFESLEDYQIKSTANRNAHGDLVEEYEIQFIDGDQIDAELFRALSISQATIRDFFRVAEDRDDHQKTLAILAVGEKIADLDLNSDDPNDLDIDIYEIDGLRELAEHFVEEGLFGDFPERLQFYIDFDAIARDLAVDYSETTIAGKRLVYRTA